MCIRDRLCACPGADGDGGAGAAARQAGRPLGGRLGGPAPVSYTHLSRLAPLPEAAERLARHGPETARSFYAAVCAGLENLGGAEFGEIWAAALELLDLSDPARAALLNLGGSLGRYGAAEQAAAISACEAELRREAQNAAEEARVMGKLRAGLAAGGGIILAIVPVSYTHLAAAPLFKRLVKESIVKMCR